MIKVDSLAKSFGDIKAVDGISFSVKKGEILGFLGPNGAGKSTTMKMLTTFLPPTSGTANIGEFNIIEDSLEIRKLIGYLPESAPSYKDMNVYDFLAFTAEARGYRGNEQKERVGKMLELCNLKDVTWQLIDTLSKGYRQRVGFAQALIHDPDYLILDEPTDGLDPNQKQEVRNLIKNMGQEKCIILSTHILEEVDAICSRALIIDRGKIVADGTPNELRRKSKEHGAITLTLRGVDESTIVDELLKIAGVAKVTTLDAASETTTSNYEKEEKNRFTVRLYPHEGESIAQNATSFIHKKNWAVEGFTLENGDLNEVFYNLTKGAAKE